MALKCLVKVNAVNNLSDARYCAGMGVAMLGYALDPASGNTVDLQNYKEINEWIAGIATVGEYGPAESSLVKKIDQLFDTDYVEVTGPERLQELQSLQKPLILTLPLDEYRLEDLDDTMDYCNSLVEYFHIASSSPVTHEHLVSTLESLNMTYPIIIGTGVHKDNVLELLDRFSLKGIALSGSDEIRPGYKDYDQLAEILELLEEDQ